MKRREFLRNTVLLGATTKLAPVSKAGARKNDLKDLKPLKPNPDNLYATAKHAMVSTSHPLATEAALDALKKGGSAVDAYLTAAVVQTVVEPCMTTLAGGLGVTYYEAKSGKTSAAGGGFANPKNETDVFTPYDYTTGRTVMVPGYVAGIYSAWRRWGKLSWSNLFEPAIDIATHGFVIDHLQWGWVYKYSHWVGRYPEGREIWYPEGYLLSVGDVLKQPRLATTLQRLVEEGPDYFYKGAWAKKFVEMVQAQGGKITLDDMINFQVKSRGNWISDETQEGERAQTMRPYREYEVDASSNAMIILALNLVEEADLRGRGRPTECSDSLYYQMRIIQEAWHTGMLYGPKTHDALVSKDYAKQVWKLIESGPPRPYQGIDAGTCAVVVVDKDGNIARGTHSSSSSPYGTGIIVDGVIANRVIYHRTVKMPNGISTHHMIFKDGKHVFVIGSPSRSFFTNVFQNTINVLEYGMDLWESVNQPLFGAPGPIYPGEEIENVFPEKVLRGIEKKGMQLMRISPRYIHMGSCHAIMIDRAKGEIRGVADPRRRGLAKGY